jgi:Tol biopolymer transport system component
MPNQPPKSIAHYSILDLLGAGGMGEGYRARDSKLGRDVALKLLPRDFTGDEERMARFAREAQVLASLNHPNIGAIYGIEDTEDSKALVLELIEGPTLEDRMKEGAVPVTEALTIARQIAEAVESAHETRVVHRDLKPANVKLTPDGLVKVLDFGLAKAMAPEQASGTQPSLSLSPTISSPMTAASVILGTAAYMSPEQARGVPVDKRADIWSFGIILFEMLSGRRLFRGETVSDVLADVLKGEPDWDTLPPDTPARIRRLLGRCMVRDPKQRLQDIGDARIVIGEALAGEEDEIPASALAAGASGTTPAKRYSFGLIATALLSAFIAAAAVWTLRPFAPPASHTHVSKFSTQVPDGTFGTSLSPDGRSLAYVNKGLWVRKFDQVNPRLLLAERGIELVPFWSPDGEWIGYGVETTIYKIPASGGDPIRIGSAPGGHDFNPSASATWLPNGKVVFSTGYAGVFEISSQGGHAVEILPPGEDEVDYHEFIVLPDNRTFIYDIHHNDGGARLGIWDGTERSLFYEEPAGEDISDLAYSPTGHLLYRQAGAGGGIWALPIDVESKVARGNPFLVVPGGRYPSIAPGGTLACVLSGTAGKGQVVQVDRSGLVVRTIGNSDQYFGSVTTNRDGTKLILAKGESSTSRELWIYDTERGATTRFTSDDFRNDFGNWSPDEEDIYYNSINPMIIYVRSADGSEEPRVISSGALPYPSPDGKYISYADLDANDSGWDIMARSLEDSAAEPWIIEASNGTDWCSPISPNGRYIAYSTEASGSPQVHVTTFPEPGKRWVVSTGLGEWPRWPGDGSELFYAAGDSIMVVDVSYENEISFGTPRLLFEREMFRWPDLFDVTAERQSFLFIASFEDQETEPEPRRIMVVQNWPAEFGE